MAITSTKRAKPTSRTAAVQPTSRKPATTKKTAEKEASVKRGAFGRPVVEGRGKPTGRVAARPARKPTPKFLFKAPEGFRSCFAIVGFRIAKDGFVAPGYTVELIRGKWNNENAPSYDLVEKDPETAAALVSRMLMLTYAPNIIRRFTPNTNYEVLLRFGMATKDRAIRVGVKTVWRSLPKKPDDLVEIVDKKDPELRKLRRSARFLPGALTKCISLDALRDEEKEELQIAREEEREAIKAQRIADREQAKLDRAAEKAAGKVARNSRAPREAKARARR